MRRGPGGEPADFAALLARAADGNGRAFEHLYERLHRRVLAFLRLRACPDPEFTLNGVFLQVFTNLGTFRGNEAQFNAWVFRITRNRLIDDARRRDRQAPVIDLDSLDEGHWLWAPDDTERDALAGPTPGSALAHLRVLTPEQAEVLLLRTVADLTVAEVAEVVGRPVGAVKQLQRRALRSLARALEADPAEGDRAEGSGAPVPLPQPRDVTGR